MEIEGLLEILDVSRRIILKCNLKIKFGENDWVYMAVDRGQWQVVTKTVKNMYLLKRGNYFLLCLSNYEI